MNKEGHESYKLLTAVRLFCDTFPTIHVAKQRILKFLKLKYF